MARAAWRTYPCNLTPQVQEDGSVVVPVAQLFPQGGPCLVSVRGSPERRPLPLLQPYVRACLPGAVHPVSHGRPLATTLTNLGPMCPVPPPPCVAGVCE
jgi:hypothetical protein